MHKGKNSKLSVRKRYGDNIRRRLICKNEKKQLVKARSEETIRTFNKNQSRIEAAEKNQIKPLEVYLKERNLNKVKTDKIAEEQKSNENKEVNKELSEIRNIRKKFDYFFFTIFKSNFNIISI